MCDRDEQPGREGKDRKREVKRLLTFPRGMSFVPAGMRIFARYPSSGVSKPMVALSVSISASRSPSDNSSPSAFAQLTSVPISMVGLEKVRKGRCINISFFFLLVYFFSSSHILTRFHFISIDIFAPECGQVDLEVVRQRHPRRGSLESAAKKDDIAVPGFGEEDAGRKGGQGRWTRLTS